ncbi:MAG: class I SAM-dependent methyltransferase [Actinomycetota bacterium]
MTTLGPERRSPSQGLRGRLSGGRFTSRPQSLTRQIHVLRREPSEQLGPGITRGLSVRKSKSFPPLSNEDAAEGPSEYDSTRRSPAEAGLRASRVRRGPGGRPRGRGTRKGPSLPAHLQCCDGRPTKDRPAWLRLDRRAVPRLGRSGRGGPSCSLRRRFRPAPAARCEVLDLGCGAGEPSTRFLAERFDVTGVDISSSQLRGAKQRLPKTSFIQADIARPMFRGAVFDGVVALYSISHIPRSEHDAVFRRIASWLKPGGIFLATLGAAQGPDWYGDWLGVPMFFSSFDADRNRELLRSAGFHLLVDEVVEMTEPEGPVSFLWVLARKPE